MSAPERICAQQVTGWGGREGGVWRNHDDPNGETTEYVRADLCQPQWQPIETAPKDGTPVWLHRPDRIGRGSRRTISKFDRDEFAKNPRPFWKSYYGGLGVLHDRDNPPTHWMPLPKPPVAS